MMMMMMMMIFYATVFFEVALPTADTGHEIIHDNIHKYTHICNIHISVIFMITS